MLAFSKAMRTTKQGLHSWYMGLFQAPYLVEALARWEGGPVDQGLRRTGMRRDEVARFREEIVAYDALGPALGWYRALPLKAGRGAELIPVSTPIAYVPLKAVANAEFGRIAAGHPRHADYHRYLKRTVEEPFALFLPG